MGTWLNSDGLYIKYGQSNDTTANLGEYDFDGPDHYIELIINGTALATATDSILADNVQLPAGCRVKKVELYIETAFTGATATLDVGTISTDRSTVYSATGLVAAAAVATLTPAGTTITITKSTDTAGGAQVGTTLAGHNLITAGANTALFTAGRARLRVFYYMP